MDLAHDIAHKDTDKALGALGRRVRSVYREAQKDVQKKLDAFTRRFKEKDKIYRQQVKDGKITEAQYQAWLRGQVFQGGQWQAKLSQLTDTLTHADEVAQKIINGQQYGVFANNANWQSYLLEHEAGLNFGFDLYDSSTVERLLRDDPTLLPRYRLDIPKDQQWNQSLITRQITQGIIQGESLDKIAKRLEKVTDRDKNLCLTRARTAMTGAQNAGRIESLTRAGKMGIKVKKEWLATLDGHTRTSHRKLDGVSIPVGEKFQGELGELEYPGDPHAAPGETYNCRCTLVGDLVDYPDLQPVERYDNIDGKPVKDMTYGEWQRAKGVEKPVETVDKPKLSVVKAAAIAEDLGEFDEFEYLINPEYAEKWDAAHPKVKTSEELGQMGLAEEEYPAALRLTKSEADRLEKLNRFWVDEEQIDDKKFHTDTLELAFLRGEGDGSMLQKRVEDAKRDIEIASEMIKARKAEGYHGKSRLDSYLEYKEMRKALATAGGDEELRAEILDSFAVGESGIRYWQVMRKDAERELEKVDFWKKLLKRKKYADSKLGG